MLSGRYWPYHPKPQPDELLSSWILRTAAGHGQAPYTFCHTVWRDYPVLTRDVDNFSDPLILNTMAERTATPLERAAATLLPAYEGWLVERYFPFGRTRWVLRNSQQHRVRRLPGLQFCPRCLEAGASPYYRRSWRLALTAVCSRHSVLLLDHCPECGAHVMPHRAKEPHLCSRCDFDLRQAPAEPADFPTIVLHRRHDTFLARGWADLAEAHFPRSHLYFDLLHQVTKVLAFGPRSQALRDVVAKQWGGDPRPPARPRNGGDFETLGVADRHRVLALAARVLEGWPFRFVGACADARVWHSWAMKDFPGAPFAYEDEIRTYLYRPFYKPSSQERAQARIYLARLRLKPTKNRLLALLGNSQTFNSL